jgi:type II secretory pathway pseudopilin PulG
VELTVAFVVFAILAGLGVVAIQAQLSRTDAALSAQSIDRVVQAQVSYASVYGTYAYGVGGDDGDLQQRLPETVTRSLTLTHGTSQDPDQVSVAVGSEQTLVVAARLPDGACTWRVLPVVTALGADELASVDVERSSAVTCQAALLLPAGELPVWQ